ncbi:MAG: Ig-like domain-containing protein [Elusimicrobia bacterium]|nr:Ig-like domain-containing protein [Elusimicrobiota bacterium]
MSNSNGENALTIQNSNLNTISQSTITSTTQGLGALYVLQSASNTILSSYIQGSSAAYVSGSTGTVFGGSMLVATNATGRAVTWANGGVNLTIATSTLLSASQGRGLALETGNAGTVSLGSVTFMGSGRGIEISTQAGGFVLSIDSVTFRGLASGATAVHFLGGTFVSTINLANFEDVNVGANISGAALDLASRVMMSNSRGVRRGAEYENDPNSLVDWPGFGASPGCAVTKNVGAGQAFATISAAVDDLRANNNPLTGHSCVVIRDAATYSEQVTVRNFTNNGSAITFMVDQSVVGKPVVAPNNAASTAAFVVANASVNILGIDIAPSAAASYGIVVSSAHVTISSVNVLDALGNIGFAGISLSSWNAVSYSSVTVAAAHGIYLAGGGMTTVSHSTAQNSGAAGIHYALYLWGASSNTMTRSLFSNTVGRAAILDVFSHYNTISLSTVSSPGYALRISASSSNTVTGSYLISLGNFYGSFISSNANYNTIGQSTMVSTGGSGFGLRVAGSVGNNFIGDLMSGANGAVAIEAGGGLNIISLSTLTTTSSSLAPALVIAGSSSDTVTSSYIQGSTAAQISGSTGTVISGSLLAATHTGGAALALSNGSSNLTLSDSRLLAGSQGAGVYLDRDNAGLIRLATNTITGGRYASFIAAQDPSAQIWITSNTILPALSATQDTYGLYFNGLLSGATMQDNSVYYRSPAANAGRTAHAFYIQSSAGLLIDRNRVNNPGMVSAGSFKAFYLSDGDSIQITRNDVHSTGAGLTDHVLLHAVNGSNGLFVKNNIFVSSGAASGLLLMADVDAGSQAGFTADYNDYFSTNAAPFQWGGAVAATLADWQNASVQDLNTISADPLWAGTGAGAEDFHPFSTLGRCANPPSCTVFTNDALVSATIDAGDPAESAALEPVPNGGRLNQGSYGNTPQASRSVGAVVTGIAPDGGWVSVSTSVTVSFNKAMSVASFNGVLLSAVLDSNGVAISTLIAGTTNYFAASRRLVFTPSASLAKNHLYQVLVTTHVKDAAGNPIASSATAYFSTAFDHAATNVLAPTAGVTLLVPANAFSADGGVTISTGGQNSTIQTATAKLLAVDRFSSPVAILDITASDTAGNPMQPAVPLTMTVPFSANVNPSFIDGTNPPVRVSTLSFWWLDPVTASWVRIPGAEITSASTLTAPVPHFSTFALIGGQDGSLSNAFAYPVPYVPSKQATRVITFQNLSTTARIRIFTLSGRLVRQIDVSDGTGRTTWDVKNSDGQDAASGAYFYLIESNSEKKKGELIIVR